MTARPRRLAWHDRHRELDGRSSGAAQNPFVEAPHRLHEKLLRAEVERVTGNLRIRLDFEVDVLLGDEHVRRVERWKLTVGRVHDAPGFDQKQNRHPPARPTSSGSCADLVFR